MLGGLAVILALGIDPFAQNLVRYYPGLVDDPYSQAVTGASTLYNLQGPVVSRAAGRLHREQALYQHHFSLTPAQPRAST